MSKIGEAEIKEGIQCMYAVYTTLFSRENYDTIPYPNFLF